MTYHKISIDYGAERISHFLPKGRGTVQVIESPEVKSEITSLEDDFVKALENPTGKVSLKELVKEHYPGWDISVSLTRIFEEIVKRWKDNMDGG